MSLWTLVVCVGGGEVAQAQTANVQQELRFEERKTGQLAVLEGDHAGLTYQTGRCVTPKGGERFASSDFIHPLRTPAGFVLTDFQPNDHLHHLGLWWPWKYLKVDGRQINCWEMQRGEGHVEARKVSRKEVDHGTASFTVEGVYTDRKAPGGPVTLLEETDDVTVTRQTAATYDGYLIDLKITHRCAVQKPIEIEKYNYSGFCFRGTPMWSTNNSTLLTSEGHDRDHSQATQARWVLVQGQAAKAAKAGILLMSHPANPSHPELLRTWDSKAVKGNVFVNFNPVQKESILLKPGTDLVRRYRVFAFDGTLSQAEADALWKVFAQR